MEWAAGVVVFAGFAQLDATVHHFDYVDAVQQVIDKMLRDAAHE